jgi:serine-type D-Ala-D-Ala carboxypeptidase (penicillin-binding protein 5/6)
VIAEAPLVAKTAVAEAGFFGRLWDGFLMWWDKL